MPKSVAATEELSQELVHDCDYGYSHVGFDGSHFIVLKECTECGDRHTIVVEAMDVV